MRIGTLAWLLFLSGACSLVYQICWFREFRLTFGATAMASAAVMGVFIAGVGIGNAALGRLADASRRPVGLYALAEAGIAITVAVSPLVIDMCHSSFMRLGGEATLGAFTATLVRIGMVAAAIAIPTFLMGGTLPFVARAVAAPSDAARRGVALVYGANTLGAVAGAAVATFFLIEAFGTRTTLWAACVVNLLVAACAGGLAPIFRRLDPADGDVTPPEGARVSPLLAYVMCAGAGFGFFMMELVWYRLLGPILGGTTFTFGLILAVALAGVGLGSVAYSIVFARREPTLDSLAASCVVQGLALGVPFALGDRLAILAGTLREQNASGFAAEVVGWALVACIVIGPAAIVSGFQFPLVIGLLGTGNRDVGRHVGNAFLVNAAGCILGSLAGGFGLLPLLTAPFAWRATGVVAVVAGAVLVIAGRPPSVAVWSGNAGNWRRIGPVRMAILSSMAIVALWMLLATEGPTAVWRHAGIGAGRSRRLVGMDANQRTDWMHSARRGIKWEADGVEASVGIKDLDGLSFFVNGKSDGHAVSDAGTQIGLALIGACLHERPTTAFVVGLGTGETAGWLAAVDTVERVDVAEIEPAVVEMARRCRVVNHGAVDHPKVRIVFNDAREMLLTGRGRYDLIACEPSNPYRSGVANLFTREFYSAARARLADGGLFLQWLQSYEVDWNTFRSVVATFKSVFPHVEVWQTLSNDVILVGAVEPRFISGPGLRRRVRDRAIESGFVAGWHVTGVEGFLSRYVGGAGLVEQVLAAGPALINTDDRNVVEFGFARSLGRRGLMSSAELRDISYEIGDWKRPLDGADVDDPIDWDAVDRTRQWDLAMEEDALTRSGRAAHAWITDDAVLRYAKGDKPGMLAAWESRGSDAACLTEASVMARAYAELGDARAPPLIEQVRSAVPAEAAILDAKLAVAGGDTVGAVSSLCRAFHELRQSPWMMPALRENAFAMADGLSRIEPDAARRLLDAVSETFAVDVARESRISCCCRIAEVLGATEAVPFVESFEPFVPWKLPFLEFRRRIYAEVGHRLAERAARDVAGFEAEAREAVKRRESQ